MKCLLSLTTDNQYCGSFSLEDDIIKNDEKRYTEYLEKIPQDTIIITSLSAYSEAPKNKRVVLVGRDIISLNKAKRENDNVVDITSGYCFESALRHITAVHKTDNILLHCGGVLLEHLIDFVDEIQLNRLPIITKTNPSSGKKLSDNVVDIIENDFRVVNKIVSKFDVSYTRLIRKIEKSEEV